MVIFDCAERLGWFFFAVNGDMFDNLADYIAIVDDFLESQGHLDSTLVIELACIVENTTLIFDKALIDEPSVGLLREMHQ